MRLPLLGTFAALSSALALGITWDAGYAVFSLESLAVLLLALLVATVLALLARPSGALRMALLTLLCCFIVDVFYVADEAYAWPLIVLAPIAAAFLHRRLPPQAFLVAALVFAGGLAVDRLGHEDVAVPPVAPRSGGETSLVVHWVLDEMGSFESVPPQFRVAADVDAITQAYAARGFMLPPAKPSTSAETVESLGRLVGGNVPPAVERKGSNFAVVRNEVVEQFRQSGWQVSVTQSSYLDFCRGLPRCATYDVGHNAWAFSSAGLPWRERAALLWGEALVTLLSPRRESAVVVALRRRYPDFFAAYTSWSWARPGLSLAVLETLEAQGRYVAALEGRHYVFAHLLLPHFPWNLDRDCSLRPVDEWVVPYAARSPRAAPEVRAKAFDAYWRQQVCAHRRALALIDRIDAAQPGRVQFLIHGDHGPRILLRNVPPGSEARAATDPAVRNALEPFLAWRLAEGAAAQVQGARTLQDATRILLGNAAGDEGALP